MKENSDICDTVTPPPSFSYTKSAVSRNFVYVHVLHQYSNNHKCNYDFFKKIIIHDRKLLESNLEIIYVINHKTVFTYIKLEKSAIFDKLVDTCFLRTFCFPKTILMSTLEL